MSVKMRQFVEKEISKAIVAALLKAGYQIVVDNGDTESKPMSNQASIMRRLFLTDEDRLYVRRGLKNEGWVYLVYGNDGWGVLNDYTVNLEKFIGDGTPVEKIIKKWSD